MTNHRGQGAAVNTITMHLGDVRDRMADLPDGHADLLVTSPPFLALRSYLPADHPDKHREIGSEPTPAAFLDMLYGLSADWRRLVPEWGSICVELGDTMSGSGGAGGDYNADGLRDGQAKFGGSGRLARYSDQRGNPDGMRDTTFQGGNTRTGGGPGWPESKSMCLIPHLYTIGLAYGHNPLTGQTHDAGRWRIRNVVAWSRPNPPVGSLGKRNVEKRTGDQKFRPATSFITIACTGTGRYFDLDAVRVEASANTHARSSVPRFDLPSQQRDGNWSTLAQTNDANPAGAPPLDWHADDLDGDWLWKLATAPYKGSHYACVDDQTEALTPHGWRRHDQLRDGDLIATWSADTETWRFEAASFHRYDYDDELVAIDKRVTNQRLTPNHRVVYATRKDPTWRVRRADSLTGGCRLPLAAAMDDGGVGPGEKAAALAGWFCTEGGIHNGWPTIHQSLTTNPHKVDAIRSLLDGIGADYREIHRDHNKGGSYPYTMAMFQVRGALAEWLRQFHKHLAPSVVFGWSEIDARALFDAMVDGDGHRRPDGRMSFIQKAKPVAEAFQMLAVRLGYRTTISQRANDGQWMVYVSPGRTVDLRKGDGGGDPPTTRERYTGTVWCPSVSTGMWLARRGGQPFVTGNTFPLTLPRRLILAMCPQRVCTVCGWPSERISTVDYVTANGGTVPTDDPWRTGRGGEVLGLSGGKTSASSRVTTLGFTDCGHDNWRPGRVLDPFGGSGTTAIAAALEGRDAVLIDIDRRNIDLVHRRLTETVRIVDRVDTEDTVTWTVETVTDRELQAINNGQTSLFDPPAA